VTARASLLIGLLLLPGLAGAKVLPVPVVAQENGQWCWAAITRAILSYYGHDLKQCTIAEYTRSVATWHDFGKTDCCTDASQGCDYWNYYGKTPGSIADILNHFGTLGAKGIEQSVTDAEVDSEINTRARPLVVRWRLPSGNGHFVVAHGLDSGMLTYMNPFPHEGKKVAKLSWVREGGGHKWTHTVHITSTCRCTKKSQCCDGCAHLKAGASCDDGDLCTEQDGCADGTCAGEPKRCLVSIPCIGPGTCDKNTGACKHPTLADGRSCPGGVCKAGVCVPTPDQGPADLHVVDGGADPVDQSGCAVGGGRCQFPLIILTILALIVLRRRPCSAC